MCSESCVSPASIATSKELGDAQGITPDNDAEPPLKTYVLFNRAVLICEGDCSLINTGWRVWAGAWLLAKYFENKSKESRHKQQILDLSCGTGLAGIALALVGHDVVLCDMEINLPTIKANLKHNGLVEGQGVQVVPYAWGSSLPATMQQSFDVILCGDLLFHVWNSRLHTEFHGTLRDICRRCSQSAPEVLFAFQVRSTRQEQQVLDTTARRLGLYQEELVVQRAEHPDCPLRVSGKYRLVCLRHPRSDEEVLHRSP